MRSFLIGTALVALLAASAGAKEISNAEYQALSVKDAADLKAQQAVNLQVASTNVNPWGTAQGEAYMKAHPYDPGDLVAGKDGFLLPGWFMNFKDGGVGTSDGGGF